MSDTTPPPPPHSTAAPDDRTLAAWPQTRSGGSSGGGSAGFASTPSSASRPDGPQYRQIGPYEVVAEIGRGGMGVVYHARQPGLDRDVAIKVMLGGEHASDEAFDRFVREARAAGRLRHPGIVGVHDVGLHEGMPYIVMDFVRGKSLAELLRLEDVTVRRAIELTADIADALQHAHDHGIIHRDLKPGNVLVDEATGRPLLTDFGLAREIDAGKGLTQSGAALGTPAYMSPEQARGATVDPRTDVYGLGTVLYEMLTGRPPFEGSNQYQILGRVMRDEPVTVRRLAAQVPRDAELIALTAMAKETTRRYQRADAMALDCRRHLRGEAISARAPSVWYLLARRARRHRVPIAAAACCGLATAALVFLFGIRPALLDAAADRTVLRDALAARRAVEAEFRQLLAAGRYDDAIERHRLHFGVTPPTPALRHSARADEPEFAELARPYQVDLPGAFLARGAKRLAAGDPRARGDLANAFRAGRELPEHQDTARAALVMLAREVTRDHDLSQAAYALGLVTRAFGTEHPDTRAALAALRQRQGRLTEAAALWHAVRDVPAHAAEAAFELAGLATLLPERELPDPGTGWRVIDLARDRRLYAIRLDLDAMGAIEVQRLDGDAWTALPSIQAWPDSEPAPEQVRFVEADGDAGPELLLHRWDAERQQARIVVVDWRDGAPRVVGQGTGPVALGGFAAVDIDGDGAVEWFQGAPRALDVWQLGAGQVRYLGRWPVGCEIHGLQARANGRELLVWLGAWLVRAPHALAWRLGDPRLYFWTEAGAPIEAERAVRGGARPWGYQIFALRHAREGFCVAGEPVPGRYLHGSLAELDDGTLLFSVGHNPETKKVLPELRAGIFRAQAARDGWAEPEPWGDARNNARLGAGGWREWPIDGERHVAMHVGKTWRIVPLEGGPERVLGVPPGAQAFQLDDDLTPELIWRGNDARPMRVAGLGAFAPAPLAEVVTQDAPGDELAGPLSVLEELLEARLYEETVATADERLRAGDDSRAHYHRGQALAALARWDEAADAFEAAARDRGLAPDARLRQAHALEQRRDWARLAVCLERLAGLELADPFARESAARRLRWVRPAAALQPRVVFDRWDQAPVMLAEHPFRVALAPDGPRCFSTGDSGGGAFGRPFAYDGGPLRVEVRFRPGAIEWGANIAFGLQSVSTIDAIDGYPGSELRVYCQARGATDNPIVYWGFGGAARDGRGSHERTGDDQVVLATGAEYTAVIDYVPGLDRAWCELRDATGAVAGRLPPIDVPVPLERGAYCVGRPSRGAGGQSSSDFLAEVQLQSVTIQGGRGVEPIEFTPSTPRGWLALAGGSVVAGAWDRAALQYERALESIEAQGGAGAGALRARAHLGLALAFVRQDRVDRARAAVAAAVAADPETVREELTGRRPAALDPETLRFFQGAALG